MATVRAHRLALQAFALASAALARRTAAPGLPDWLDRRAIRALWLPLDGGADPALHLGLRDGHAGSAMPRHWQLAGSGEALPLCCQPVAAAQAQAQALPTLSPMARPDFEGSATALLHDRLGSQRYLLTCAHVAAPGAQAQAGNLISISGVPGSAGCRAELRNWQPVMAEGAYRTPIDAALLLLQDEVYRPLYEAGDLLPLGVGGGATAGQPLTLRRRGGDAAATALVYWSGEVDIPGVSPGVADYFLERAIGYRCAVQTQGGDSGAAVWDAQQRLVGMHLAGLTHAGMGPGEPNALFGAIQPVLDWFKVSPVLLGGQVLAPPPAAPQQTRNTTPAKSAAALGDREVIAATLWGEARNQDDQGMRAVACVIANRARTRYRRCQSAREVCLDRWQFSCWNEADPNRPKMLTVARKPDPAFQRGLALADELLAKGLTDITRGARHYHTSRIRPSWALGKTPCATVGDHFFYNDVA
jgi:Cell Wall Hydrolase/Trypsin-like peptidase domain